MIEIGILLVIAGLTLACWAIWKVSEAVVEDEYVVPYVLPFAAGMGIAIVGGFVLLGQWIWRVIA